LTGNRLSGSGEHEPDRLGLWRSRLDQLWGSVSDLLLSRRGFKEAAETLIRGHASLVAMQTLGISYQHFLAMKLRCQLDLDPRNVTMARLLGDILDNLQEVSRDRFQLRYLGRTKNRTLPTGKTMPVGLKLPDRESLLLWSREADLRFDALVGVGHSQLTEEHVNNDINRLRAVAGKARKYANRQVAHNSLHRPGPVPKSGSTDAWLRFLCVDPCIELLQSLFVKYWWLVNADAPLAFPAPHEESSLATPVSRWG
jgi:hypothetical protein